MATADKLNKLLQTKEAIRLALIEKGQAATVNTPFADYPNMILGITTEDERFAQVTFNFTIGDH